MAERINRKSSQTANVKLRMLVALKNIKKDQPEMSISQALTGSKINKILQIAIMQIPLHFTDRTEEKLHKLVSVFWSSFCIQKQFLLSGNQSTSSVNISVFCASIRGTVQNSVQWICLTGQSITSALKADISKTTQTTYTVNNRCLFIIGNY